CQPPSVISTISLHDARPIILSIYRTVRHGLPTAAQVSSLQTRLPSLWTVRSDGRISPTLPPSSPTGFHNHILHGASFRPISFPAVPVSKILVPVAYYPPLVRKTT